jgi:hypothetical protein
VGAYDPLHLTGIVLPGTRSAEIVA